MQLTTSTSGAYRHVDGGIITFVDGHIHVCIQNDSPSFPIFQRWPDHATTSGYVETRRGVRKRIGWRRGEKRSCSCGGFLNAFSRV